MNLIKIECVGPPGKRNYRKRFTVQCPICFAVVTRRSWYCLTAKSCGCVSNAFIKHGMAHKHPLYGVWRAMRARCHNPNDHAYPYYGGRGITICPEWSEFKPFFDWAITNGWSPGLFFDRQENDGNYTPSNCRFVLLLQSNRNKSNITITEAQAAEIHVLLDAGIPVREIAQILSVPLTTVENIKRQLCWRKEQLCPM